MSDEGQDVLVLASHDINEGTNITSCGQTTNVLNKLLTGTNSSGASVPGAYILYIPGFRKIEPKPGLELRSDEVVEEKESNVKDGRHASSGRFLGINATKRGVKTCPVCFNKIGYRAKQCKHCSPSKIRNPRKSRLQAITPWISKQNEMVDASTRSHHPGSSEPDQELHQRLEEPKVTHDEPHTTPVEEQPVLSSPCPPVLSEGVQLVTSENKQGSESLTPQGNQLEGILQEREDPEETLVLDKLQGTQYEEEGQIANQEEKVQQKQVINEVVVSNVTEVSTSGNDTVEKTNDEMVVTTENQDMVNEVFISSKLTQSNPSAITAGRISLQDLICGLLAQNQGTIPHGNPVEMTKNQDASTETANIAVQTDSTKQISAGKSPDGRDEDVGLGNSCMEANLEKSISTENAYDANSVALFLGEMAQRNGKKRRISSASKVTDNEPKRVTIIPGVLQKWNMLSNGEAKGAKFRKIQPKDIAYVQECEVPVCEEEKEEIAELKGESQYRIMNGNATRRGVMLCTKCSQMIGCRSKICKHCKNQVTDHPLRETSYRVIKQAIQLCLPEELSIKMFSVRKCKTGPELRCFVQFENEHDETSKTRKTCSSKYICDYPLCITAKQLVNRTSEYFCEHAKVCCVSTNVLKAKLPRLDPEKIPAMPFGNDLKEMVRVLHSQCSNKNIPLVQHVSYKTLAVVEKLNTNQSDPLGSDIASFVHVRFEKVKGDGCFQRQVFCSGRSCMGWNFISNDSPVCLMKTCGCVHFAAALWAIASDNVLLKDLREFFDAFLLQAKIGND